MMDRRGGRHSNGSLILAPLYHYSDNRFGSFDIGKASPSAIWGAGVYLSDDPGGLGGWSKSKVKDGYLYKVSVRSEADRVIDITKPVTEAVYSKIEQSIGRELPLRVKMDGLLPVLTLDRRFGSVANAMREIGFDVLIHPPPGAHRGKHYLVTDPNRVSIDEVLLFPRNIDNRSSGLLDGSPVASAGIGFALGAALGAGTMHLVKRR